MAKPTAFRGKRATPLLAAAGQQAADATTPDYANIQNVPSDFPPANHTHVAADVTDFNTAAQAAVATGQTYTVTNVTPDRGYDADLTTIDEVADVLGTLIADLRSKGIVL
jgi:hypothetical protein